MPVQPHGRFGGLPGQRHGRSVPPAGERDPGLRVLGQRMDLGIKVGGQMAQLLQRTPRAGVPRRLRRIVCVAAMSIR